MGRVVLKIDVTDWHDEVMQDEEIVTCKDDVIEQFRKGEKTGDIAKRVIISREIGKAPVDIIRNNKLLIYTGAVLDVTRIAVQQEESVELPNGKTFDVRSLLGTTRGADSEEETEEQTFITLDDPESLERAREYLNERVSGYVIGRLKIIAAKGGNPKEALSEFYQSLLSKCEQMFG